MYVYYLTNTTLRRRKHRVKGEWGEGENRVMGNRVIGENTEVN